MAGDLIGRGWAFPLGTTASGGIRLVGREAEIEQAIHLILATVPGERPMRPEFGCGIHSYVFAPADGATAGRMAFEVREALARWEPRITVQSVDVRPAFDSAGPSMLIDIRYLIKPALDPRSLVFPFYLIPAEAG